VVGGDRGGSARCGGGREEVQVLGAGPGGRRRGGPGRGLWGYGTKRHGRVGRGTGGAVLLVRRTGRGAAVQLHVRADAQRVEVLGGGRLRRPGVAQGLGGAVGAGAGRGVVAVSGRAALRARVAPRLIHASS